MIGSMFSLPSQFKPLQERGLFFTSQTDHVVRRAEEEKEGVTTKDVSTEKTDKKMKKRDAVSLLPLSEMEEKALKTYDDVRRRVGTLLVGALSLEYDAENLQMLLWTLCAKVLEDARTPGIAQIVINVVSHKVTEDVGGTWSGMVMVRTTALLVLKELSLAVRVFLCFFFFLLLPSSSFFFLLLSTLLCPAC